MKFNYCPECHRLIYPKRPPIEILFINIKDEIGRIELGEFFRALDSALASLPHLDKLEIGMEEYGVAAKMGSRTSL